MIDVSLPDTAVCRFAGGVPVPVLAAAGKYNDVFSFNTCARVDFENVWSPDARVAWSSECPAS
jgi:hypothetical protein